MHTPIDSPRQVDKKYAVFENILGDYQLQKSKNCIKIRFFKNV